MGQIFQKAYTWSIPPGAEILEINGRRVARWRLRKGQYRSGEVVDCQDGKARVRGRSRFYMARYRDGNGHIVEVATGCRDEVAARAVLTQLERRAELVRVGVRETTSSTASAPFVVNVIPATKPRKQNVLALMICLSESDKNLLLVQPRRSRSDPVGWVKQVAMVRSIPHGVRRNHDHLRRRHDPDPPNCIRVPPEACFP